MVSVTKVCGVTQRVGTLSFVFSLTGLQIVVSNRKTLERNIAEILPRLDVVGYKFSQY